MIVSAERVGIQPSPTQAAPNSPNDHLNSTGAEADTYSSSLRMLESADVLS